MSDAAPESVLDVDRDGDVTLLTLTREDRRNALNRDLCLAIREAAEGAVAEGTRVIVLAIDPAAEQQFTMTPVARWTRGVNAGLGADGLSVSTTDLRIDHDTLLDIVTAYWQAYRAG